MKNNIIIISGFLILMAALSGCSTYKTTDNNTNTNIPKNCISWFDGCNNCVVENGKTTACTLMACETMQEPKCNEFESEEINDSGTNNTQVSIPQDCVSWFDGCNNCFVESGNIG
jgi:hypothetical protein